MHRCEEELGKELRRRARYPLQSLKQKEEEQSIGALCIAVKKTDRERNENGDICVWKHRCEGNGLDGQ